MDRFFRACRAVVYSFVGRKRLILRSRPVGVSNKLSCINLVVGDEL